MVERGKEVKTGVVPASLAERLAELTEDVSRVGFKRYSVRFPRVR